MNFILFYYSSRSLSSSWSVFLYSSRLTIFITQSPVGLRDSFHHHGAGEREEADCSANSQFLAPQPGRYTHNNDDDNPPEYEFRYRLYSVWRGFSFSRARNNCL